MPLWGWLLVFFGALILVGFVADLMSKRKSRHDEDNIEKQVDEIKTKQTDYHHFL